MATKKIRALVVDDSLFMREFLSAQLRGDPSIEVVGTAADVFEARDRIVELAPDVMTLDVQMPGMDGVEFLRRLMPQYPLPVVVVSAVSGRVFDALTAGAVDFITKPELRNEAEKRRFVSELSVKLKIASIAKVGQFKRSAARDTAGRQAVGSADGSAVIAIGASTGGTAATLTILKELGDDLPGIVIVQHMPPVFTRLYAEQLNNTCTMEVREAQDGDAVRPGRVLIAPGGLHMTVESRADGLVVECREGEKVNGHCPSVDQLFFSVSRIKGILSLGILLTGMGSDGAKGLLEMKKAGAQTFAQDEQTCAVWGMPAVATSMGAVDLQLPIQGIAQRVYEWYARVSGLKA